jgi:ribosomal protein L11 methyltransferase
MDPESSESDLRPGGAAPERWLVLEVAVDGEEDCEAAVRALSDSGAMAVEELAHGVRTAFPDSVPGRAARDDALKALAEVVDRPGAVTESSVPHELWEESWRHGLGPRQVSPRILVRPSWSDPVPLGEGVHELVLDPGVAFGTAEHATTRGALRLLDGLCRPGQSLLDLGSGSAILSIAAALLGARRVVAVDFDPFATGAALENVAFNQVESVVEVREAMLTATSVAALGPVDGILANIQSHILIDLLPGISTAVVPGGWVILSGILQTEAADMRRAAEGAGLLGSAEDAEGEWWTAAFTRAVPDSPPPSAATGRMPE